MPVDDQTLWKSLYEASPEERCKALASSGYQEDLCRTIGDRPIEVLGLSPATVERLQKQWITTVGELVRAYRMEWRSGPLFYQDLSRQLESYIRVAAQTFTGAPTGSEDDDAARERRAAIAYYIEHPLPLTALGLSSRAYNALRRAGIASAHQLLACSEEQLHEIRNLGKKTLEEIRAKCEELTHIGAKGGPVPVGEQTDDPVPFDRMTGPALLRDPRYREDVIGYYEKKAVPIEALGLPTRPYHIMQREGIQTFADLLHLYPEDLSELPSIGKGTKDAITRAVEQRLTEDTEALQRWIWSDHMSFLSDEEIQRMLLSLYTKKTGFYGFSFKEFRAAVPEEVPDADIRRNVSTLLREGRIEYVDFRCYPVYPRFADHVAAVKSLDAEKRDMLLARMRGQTLQEIGAQYGVTRERIRQIIEKTLRQLRRTHQDRLFDEDYHRYLYEHYAIPKQVWYDYLGCDRSTFDYLSSCCDRRGKAPLEEALDDPDVTVNQKYRLQKYLDSQMIRIGDTLVTRNKTKIERALLAQYCQDGMPFDEFIALYDAKLREAGIPEEDGLYYSEEERRTRENQLAKMRYVLWTHGKKLRYYPIDRYDFTALLEAIDLGQFRDVEISTDLFLQRYPAVMAQYDIRDANELHQILKKLDAETIYEGMALPRQPIIRFGKGDRVASAVEIIREEGPLTSAALTAALRERFGFSDEICMNLLAKLKEHYHNGEYSVDYALLSPTQQAQLADALTEDFYTLDEARAIYASLFPDAGTLDPRALKQMGFVVNVRYLIRGYASAEAYMTDLLTREDVIDLAAVRKRHAVCYNTFSAVLYRLLHAYDVLYLGPDRLLSIRCLQKRGVTKETLRGYCDAALAQVEDGTLFTVHMLRQDGFTHPLDDLGMDDYFYDSLLAQDARCMSTFAFGKHLLHKGDPVQSLERVTLFKAILRGQHAISLAEIGQRAKGRYGIDVTKDKYDLIHFVDMAAQALGMYYDRTMEKVYKDKSYYYKDLENVEKEALF